MSRFGLSTVALLALAGCSESVVNLDHAAPAASISTTSDDTAVVLNEERSAVWVDDQRLYWITGYLAIRSCRKDDCAHTLVDYNTSTLHEDRDVLGASVAGTHVFWASLNTLYACPIGGCESRPVTIAKDPAFHVPMFANGDYVYWSSDFDIYRCRASGCSGAPEVLAADSSAQAMAFDDGRAYWIDGLRIMSAPVDGSEPPTVVFDRPEARVYDAGDFVIGGGYLYWLETFRVFRCAIMGCGTSGPTLVVTGEGPLSNLTLDGSTLYRVEANTLLACALPDCEESTAISPLGRVLLHGLASDPPYAIDASDIYWIGPRSADPATTVIHRTAK